MRIFLIRHAESTGNLNHEVYKKNPDHSMKLTQRGKLQATKAGSELNSFLNKNIKNNSNEMLEHMMKNILSNFGNSDMVNKSVQERSKARLWISPYDRTRETANLIKQQCSSHLSEISRESVFLVEQQYGLFSGVALEDRDGVFKQGNDCFKLQGSDNGAFWKRFPMGESLMDVATRVQLVINQIVQESEMLGTEDHIIVGHSTSLRIFTMLWFGHPYEWIYSEPHPGNCSIRLIEDMVDRGYIFNGYNNGNYIDG